MIGKREHVFANSMSDLFERGNAVADSQRARLWPLIQQTPWLEWGLITKRFDNVIKNLPWGPNEVPWENVWIGMSVENDLYTNLRLPTLVKINAVVRFVICEPLLGPLPSLPKFLPGLDWVMVGGESCDSNPRQARPMKPAWVEGIWKDCQAAGVPFHFKQWGSQQPIFNADGKTGHFHAMNRYHPGADVFNGQTWKCSPVPKLGKPRVELIVKKGAA